jgi:endogenous inhibitor of DNA gyrase (YacG/DUF329 family)
LNWLARTHQRWKLATGIAVLVAAGVCMAFGTAAFAQCDGPAYAYCATADRGMFLQLAGASVGLLAMIWVLLSVRCPVCGRRVVWWAMSTKPVNAWLIAVLATKACPSCGDAGTGREEASSGTGA